MTVDEAFSQGLLVMHTCAVEGDLDKKKSSSTNRGGVHTIFKPQTTKTRQAHHAIFLYRASRLHGSLFVFSFGFLFSSRMRISRVTRETGLRVIEARVLRHYALTKIANLLVERYGSHLDDYDNHMHRRTCAHFPANSFIRRNRHR